MGDENLSYCGTSPAPPEEPRVNRHVRDGPTDRSGRLDHMDVAILAVSIAALMATVAFGVVTVTYNRRAERRAITRSHVDWVLERLDKGDFRLLNVGRDSAHEVAATVELLDEEPIRATADRVDPDGAVPFHSVRAEDNAEEAEDELIDYLEKRDRPTNAFLPQLIVTPPIHLPFKVTARVTWHYPTGRWDERVVVGTFQRLRDS